MFREMATLCVRSLRGPGCYSGDITVFTNNNFRAVDRRVQTIAMPNEMSTQVIRQFKARAHLFIEHRRYDAIMSMDADMLAVRDIRPLLGYRVNRACGMKEKPWTRMSDRSCRTCLTKAEQMTARHRWGVNGGLLCTPGHLFQEYMELWDREIARRRGALRTWINQPPLNALILRRKINFTAYPEGWITMPQMYQIRGRRDGGHKNARILHFCCPSKTLGIIEMELAFAKQTNRAGRSQGAVLWRGGTRRRS